MAHSDKNIVITPNIGSTTADPQIVFSGANASLGPQNITLRTYPTSNGTLSFEGSAGQLFSITNSMSGSIFSVNDVSGIPSIEVLDTGVVRIAQYSGRVLIGTATDNGIDKVQVVGNVRATSFQGNGSQITGITAISDTAPSSPSAGNLWWNSNTAQLYIYYNDGDSAQWVTAARGPAGPQGPAGPMGPAAILSDQTVSATTHYPTLTTVINGTATSLVVSSTKMSFVPSTGTLTVTNFVESSSITLKENISPIENALDSILKLSGVTYDRIDSKEHEAGLIAEWTNEVLPDLVTKDSLGNIIGIKYTKLTAYLIESIKTLKQEINELRDAK
jgi:hypothetical protein